jgi:hypothetical protein
MGPTGPAGTDGSSGFVRISVASNTVSSNLTPTVGGAFRFSSSDSDAWGKSINLEMTGYVSDASTFMKVNLYNLSDAVDVIGVTGFNSLTPVTVTAGPISLSSASKTYEIQVNLSSDSNTEFCKLQNAYIKLT